MVNLLRGKELNAREIMSSNMWEQVKLAMVESAREVCSSVKVGGKNPKRV